jgi:hypothetical protein
MKNDSRCISSTRLIRHKFYSPAFRREESEREREREREREGGGGEDRIYHCYV